MTTPFCAAMSLSINRVTHGPDKADLKIQWDRGWSVFPVFILTQWYVYEIVWVLQCYYYLFEVYVQKNFPYVIYL